MNAQVVSKALILSLFSVFLILAPLFSAFASECVPYSVEYVSSGETATVVGGGAAVATFMSPLWTPVFAGASWVWESEEASNPEDGEVKVFQTTFSLPGEVTKSTLLVSVDDYFVATANGSEFASEYGEGNFLPENVFEYDLNAFLHKGENTLEFEVTNAKYYFTGEATPQLNPAGLLFKLTVEGTLCTDSPSQTSQGGGTAGPNFIISGGTQTSPVSSGNGVQGGTNNGQVMSAQTEDAAVTPVGAEDVVNAASESVTKDGSWILCFIKSLLLILLVIGLWVVMHALAKRHNKHAAAAVVDAELVIYALASTVIIFVLWLLGAFCVLPFFVLGMLILMAWRMFGTRNK